MENHNQTSVTEFILLGLTDDPVLQVPLFALFLLVYSLTLISNIGIMVLIKLSPRLHNPMYFLLSNLSFVDLCYSSNITPNMLVNFLSEKKLITFLGCAVQMFLFAGLGSTEALLLAVMAYDRYAAICKPLLYHVIMTENRYTSLAALAYILGFLNSLVHTSCTFRLSFCDSNNIAHFFCDVPPLLKLSCSDTSLNEIVLFTVAGCVEVGSLLVIIVSYVHIVSAILRIRSSEGRRRAFSTCSSHFVVVTLFYGTIIFMYLRPRSSYSLDQDKVVSVFYTAAIPLLNPLIYSLRNQEVKAALKEIVLNETLT
ncbi:olfactory receptor 5AP2-like isoform X1 [Pleurodeles waltl]|uniref:olfactory receptor 5AP2-like isoform X1 n=1 Tax=Pleurodeles waltl TaxID=8319 RepID=UPI00370953E9